MNTHKIERCEMMRNNFFYSMMLCLSTFAPLLNSMDKPPRMAEKLKKEQAAKQQAKALYEQLVQAILRKRPNDVRALLQKGAPANYESGHDRPLSHAIRQKNQEIIRMLVKEGGADINSTEGGTFLRDALVYDEDGSLYDLMLELGANPNLREANTDTQLHGAALSGNVRIVLLLLAAGADPDVRGHEQETPLQMATRFSNSPNYQRIVEILSNPERLLEFSIRNGVAGAVRRLINSNNIDIPDAKGITPLGHAVIYNQPEMVSLLLELGADQLQAFNGIMPLDEARRRGADAIVQVLQAHRPVEVQSAQALDRAAAERQLLSQQSGSKGFWGWFKWGGS